MRRGDLVNYTQHPATLPRDLANAEGYTERHSGRHGKEGHVDEHYTADSYVKHYTATRGR